MQRDARQKVTNEIHLILLEKGSLFCYVRLSILDAIINIKYTRFAAQAIMNPTSKFKYNNLDDFTL